MINLIYIATGGAVGAIFRFVSSNFFKILFPNFPIGTLFVNFIGSFFIGFLLYILENQYSNNSSFIKYFLIIGLLGSFTTFSAFSIETVQLLNDKKFILSIIYILLSVLLCISGAFVGYSINRLSL